MSATAPPSAPSTAARLRRSIDLQPVLVPFFALVLAMAIGSIVIVLVGENPIEAYWALLRGMFGSWERLWASLARSTPYIGAALAVAFAFRAGLFNIGVEGQLLVGATLAAWVGTWSFVADTPAILAVIIVVFAGALGGGLYGAIPGVLKARTGAHEVITTIMLNAIALLYVRWLVSSQDPLILRDPLASVPGTRPLPDSALLPTIVHSVPPLHVGTILMVALCGGVWYLLQYMTTGFEIRAVGANPQAARYAGIRVNRIIVLVMALSGAFAGLAGASEVAGTTGYLKPGVFVSVGFDSIAIALLARANPWAIIPAAVLWGAMLSGAPLMQLDTGLSIDIVRIVQALILLFVAADVIVRTIFRIRGPMARTGAMQEAGLSSRWGAG